MNTARIQQLLAFVQEEPNDPFNVYALALEFLNSDPTQAQQYFDELLVKHPNYLPTYYHAAQLCADLGNETRALMLYEQGIELARQQANPKTERELRSAMQVLADE
jgi:tetratricopeptide (TPR) repeat protein